MKTIGLNSDIFGEIYDTSPFLQDIIDSYNKDHIVFNTEKLGDRLDVSNTEQKKSEKNVTNMAKRATRRRQGS